MINGLVPLFLGLAACQTTPFSSGPTSAPTPAPDPGAAPYQGQAVDRGDYRAIGTEPFWDLTFGERLTFTDRGNNLSVSELAPPMQNGTAGAMYNGRRLKVNVVGARCSDGMSERIYPDTVTVTVDGRRYDGCGAPASFFLSVDARGNPQMTSALAGPETALERTRWRVVRINGRAVPRRGAYTVDFDSGRIAAKFGCSVISAPYSQNNNTLDAGLLTSTRMACFNVQLETEGSLILDQVMTVAVTDRNRLTLSSNAGTIDMVRR